MSAALQNMSFIYRQRKAYDLLNLFLYGRYYKERLRAIADHIPKGASVFEVCCGFGGVHPFLSTEQQRSYCGLDLNLKSISWGRKQGIHVIHGDLTSYSLPIKKFDCFVIQGSLYHFIPDEKEILTKLCRAAKRCVILSEPIRNMGSSKYKLIAKMAQTLTNPGTGAPHFRFTEASLSKTFQEFSESILVEDFVPGRREKIYVLRSTND